jgi:hypothetical protein
MGLLLPYSTAPRPQDAALAAATVRVEECRTAAESAEETWKLVREDLPEEEDEAEERVGLRQPDSAYAIEAVARLAATEADLQLEAAVVDRLAAKSAAELLYQMPQCT